MVSEIYTSITFPVDYTGGISLHAAMWKSILFHPQISTLVLESPMY